MILHRTKQRYDSSAQRNAMLKAVIFSEVYPSRVNVYRMGAGKFIEYFVDTSADVPTVATLIGYAQGGRWYWLIP